MRVIETGALLQLSEKLPLELRGELMTALLKEKDSIRA